LTFERKTYLTLAIAWVLIPVSFAQTASLSGTINDYAAIEEIHAYEENDVDSVLLSAPPVAFSIGDTVMVFVVKGAGVRQDSLLSPPPPKAPGIPQPSRYSGKYAFMIIDAIDGNTVVLNTSFYANGRNEIGVLADGEVAQLIRVPYYRRAEVNGTVSALPWDGSKGGVVAMFVSTTLTLNADIDVTGQGFRGASESASYTPLCSSTNPPLYDSAFYQLSGTTIRAGIKGEGISNANFQLLRGRARNINGGGGGNGLFSGGGGGSNYTSGGRGGDESDACATGVDQPGGSGGFPFFETGGGYYVNLGETGSGDVLNRYNRIFFGGGGGTGTARADKITTDGAAGGGLVVIVADTIIGDGVHGIIADGGDVTSVATGAAGGGGGGGGIILDVSGYKNNVIMRAIGGKGGDTNDSDVTGPGGGGGGGIYWLAGSSYDGAVPVDDQNSEAGMHIPTSGNHNAAEGGFPDIKLGLEAPLRGFLFNSVPTAFYICSDQEPATIFASEPKGGDGSYSYLWVDSSATQNQWLPAPGTNNQQNYDFEGRTLDDTTYFRRVVTSGLLDPDTSFRIAVYVHQAIEDNVVAAEDTVCRGMQPEAFTTVGTPSGALGPGTYQYSWIRSTDQSSWVGAPGDANQSGYQAPELEVTTWFSRVARSGVCTDTSSALRVSVLEPLTGNDITPFDTICRNASPDLMTGPVPGGGDAGDKRYAWQGSPTSGGPWTNVGAAGREYQSGPLTTTRWFRRIALSGIDDACRDTSNAVEILNLDPVTGNDVITSEQNVCTNVQPVLLQGSSPGGGYQSTYSYRWESTTLSTGWVPAGGNPNQQRNFQPPVMTGDTTWYRRIVGSGGVGLDVCLDTSDAVAVNVLPLITNNEVSPLSDILCQGSRMGMLTGTVPGGGATQGGNDPTRNYKWEVATGTGSPASGWTEVSYGFDQKDYTDMPELSETEDYWYRRIVFSGPGLGGQEQVCRDVSDTVHVTIHTAITQNTIDPADSACYNSEKEVIGGLPAGEAGLTPVYAWLDDDTGSLLGGTGQNYTRLYDREDPYHFRRITSIGQCTDTSNLMTVTVMQLPGGQLSADIPISCEKDTLFTVDLNMEALTTYTTPWALYLDDGVNEAAHGPYFVDGDGPFELTLETVEGEASTRYTYTLDRIEYASATGRFLCVSDPGALGGQVDIEVFHRPRPSITVNGTEVALDSICGSSLVLEVDPDFGTGYWSNDPPEYMSYAPHPSATQVTASIPETDEAWGVENYTLTFYSQAGDCAGTDTIELFFYEQPEDAYAGRDTTIYLKNSLKMNADPPTAGTGTWTLISGSGEIEDKNDPNTFVYNLEKETDNSFRWTVTNGNCVTSQHVTIVSHREILRYEGFSPNGDMINDVFVMRGLVDATEFRVTFFNSLGNTVREVDQNNVHDIDFDPAAVQGGLRDDELVVWDGLARNGNPAPSGTYYYQVTGSIDQVDPQGNVTGTDRFEYTGFVVLQYERE